ncbi:MAG: MFS transporter, partial [Flavobacteriia bacterium]|nr:MFS transporter [Flavobacteriia bacterium]
MIENHTQHSNRKIIAIVVVAALGYFVDIYDLVLFGVIKAESLKQIMIGTSPALQAATGKFLFNMQMIGMLIGGVIWGVLGDKRGRLQVLFGSILLYSLANIANAFVSDISTYAVIRIIAGIGLAGELGAGITLVSEMMSKEKRGYGTMIIVTFGALGAVFASLVGSKGDYFSQIIFNLTNFQLASWQVAYIIGGLMGFILLFLRIGTIEPYYFKAIKAKNEIKKGSFKLIFSSKPNRIKYLHCILIGIPIWFIIGLIIMNSKDDFGPWVGLKNIENGTAVMYAYIGLSFGDLISGLLSQVLKSRKKVVFLYLSFTAILTLIFLFFGKGMTATTYYFFCFLLGTGTGYWAIFVTIAAEQFGTNIRSTAANTIPNFVRGSVNVIMLLFSLLLASQLSVGISAFLIGAFFIGLAFYSLSQLKETFGKELD